MIMNTSLLFEAFMIFYLLEVLFLAVLAWQLNREYQEEEQNQVARAASPSGPSASDLIKMRARVKELQRQG